MHSSPETTAHLVGLVGAGVLPSKTPPLHMAEARAQGIPYVYRTIDLPSLELTADDLPTILDWAQRLGFTGLNITHPCKQLVLEHLDRIDPIAAALGAVNTVVFTPEGRVGYNTDTTGFARAFREGLSGVERRHVVQIGAGGAGVAVADALLREGVQALTVVDTDLSRAAALADDVRARHGADVTAATPDALADALSTADGLVNCTPIGMADHPGSPVARELLRPTMWVADIVYFPLKTQLLTDALELGCRILDGGHMAVGQAVGAFELFSGVRPDAERMDRTFRELVSTPSSPAH